MWSSATKLFSPWKCSCMIKFRFTHQESSVKDVLLKRQLSEIIFCLTCQSQYYQFFFLQAQPQSNSVWVIQCDFVNLFLHHFGLADFSSNWRIDVETKGHHFNIILSNDVGAVSSVEKTVFETLFSLTFNPLDFVSSSSFGRCGQVSK